MVEEKSPETPLQNEQADREKALAGRLKTAEGLVRDLRKEQEALRRPPMGKNTKDVPRVLAHRHGGESLNTDIAEMGLNEYGEWDDLSFALRLYATGEQAEAAEMLAAVHAEYPSLPDKLPLGGGLKTGRAIYVMMLACFWRIIAVEKKLDRPRQYTG